VAAAIVFDVMGTLFDLSPLRDRLRAAGAPEGSLEAWFGRMLHGSAALTLVGEFRPFREIGKASLESILEQLGADAGRADEILHGLGELDPYPDAAAAFDELRAAGVRTATLTNGAEDHTRRLLARAELEDAVELVIAVDEVRAFKPHPAPYHHAAARLGLPVERITLVAAHGWDVVGAHAAGLGAVWIDRLERRWPFPLPEPVRAATLVEAVERALAEGGAR
jgi:2-haloacid dehalogenase